MCVSVCLPSVCVATLLDREYYIERKIEVLVLMVVVATLDPEL